MLKKLLKIGTTTRISLFVGMICAIAIWAAQSVGLIADTREIDKKHRKQLCEFLAIQAASKIQMETEPELDRFYEQLVYRNDSISHICLNEVKEYGRKVSIEKFAAEVALSMRSKGDETKKTPKSHAMERLAESESKRLPLTPSMLGKLRDKSNSHSIEIQIQKDHKPWGVLEIGFVKDPLAELNYGSTLVAFTSACVALMTWVLLARILRYLNPSKVVPNRVKSAFDTLSGGLILLDAKLNVVHTNSRLAVLIGYETHEIVGCPLEAINWTIDFEEEKPCWVQCHETGEEQCGQLITLMTTDGERKYSTSAAPIFEANGKLRGILISFDDVTVLENKKTELAGLVNRLNNSRQEIKEQNEKLMFLASRDPLTKCYNRRSFWEIFEEVWETQQPDLVNIIMVDVDHFKSVNDTHGHGVGDDVLRDLGSLLHELYVDNCVVARFGGEEFVVLVQGVTAEVAFSMAEDLKANLHSRKIGGLDITASIGVANRAFNAMDLQHLIDMADQSLYYAKRTGRDRVIRYDEFDDQELATMEDPNPRGTESKNPGPSISLSAVNGLLSAIAMRSRHLADHSMRVSNLAVSLGRRIMEPEEICCLETAALIHESGILGLPDNAVKFKASHPCSEPEFLKHIEDSSVEIAQLSFRDPKLTEILGCKSYWYSKFNSVFNQGVAMHHIPIGARILAICNAFDESMMTQQDPNLAIMELKKREHEFDPELLQEFDAMIRQQPEVIGNFEIQNISSNLAVEVTNQLEAIYRAIGEQNGDELRASIDALRAVAGDGSDDFFQLNALNTAMGNGDVEFKELSQMAFQVVDMCRATRNSFIRSTTIDQLNSV